MTGLTETLAQNLQIARAKYYYITHFKQYKVEILQSVTVTVMRNF